MHLTNHYRVGVDRDARYTGGRAARWDSTQTTTPATKTIDSSTAANPCVVTTTTAHGYTTGQSVIIRDHSPDDARNAERTITVLTTTTFSIPVNTTSLGAGTGGTCGGTTQSAAPYWTALTEDLIFTIEGTEVAA